MKRKVFEIGIGLLTLLWLVPAQARTPALMEEFVRVVKKEYPITADGTTRIENRYGKVEVHTWDKQRVRIEVRITVEARSESAAEEEFDRINIQFSHTPSSVSAVTEIESKSSWWSWGWSSSDFRIDYGVYVPPTNTVSVTNRYGDVWVDALQGDLELSVKYGNFTAEGTSGYTTFYVGYGSGNLPRAGKASGQLAYAKLRAGELEELRLESKYSRIWLDAARRLDIEGRYDNYEIGEVDELIFEGRYSDLEIEQVRRIEAVARYTDFRIETLTGSATFDLQYGNLAIDRIARGFGEVDVRSRYTDVRLQVEPGASYRLEAQCRYAPLRLPEDIELREDHEQPTTREVKGFAGTAGARSIIRAELEYGGLRIR